MRRVYQRASSREPSKSQPGSVVQRVPARGSTAALERQADSVAEQSLQGRGIVDWGPGPLVPAGSGSVTLPQDRGLDPARSQGHSLDAVARIELETRFGHDFGRIRIHHDEEAHRLNRAIDARAFTQGSHVYFRQGEYAPGTREGRTLLGHELAHAVQQSGSASASGAIQRRELTDGMPLRSLGDWTNSDRENKTQRWKDACLHNLLANDSSQYVRIIERRDFYQWFYEHTAALGYTTRWALAASIVATGAHEVADMHPAMEDLGRMTGTVSNELQGMMREGNQVIFDNVFPKLRQLLLGGPLTGRAALEWDMRILSEEQTLIQPLYMGVSAGTRAELDLIARQQGLPGAMASIMAPTVPSGPHVRGGDIPGFTGAALTSIDDRWRYGMDLGNRFTPGGSGFNPATDTRPTPSASYSRGAELARVRTRPNLHRLDAALDGGAWGASWLQAEVESILRRLAGSELEEFIRDRRPDGGRYSARLPIPRTTMFSLLATWRVSLEGQMNFLSGFIRGDSGGPWRDLHYSQLAPIIQPFSQAEKNRLHTPEWKRIFIRVCDDSTIEDAVNDLGLREPLRSQWITEERSWF